MANIKGGISNLYIRTAKYKPSKITNEIKNWIGNFMKALQLKPYTTHYYIA